MGIDESLQRLVERLVKTWNDRDWASFSQLFADNAHYVTGAGVCLAGRQRIHDNFVTRVPASAEAERVSLVMQSIHLLGTDAAVLLCSWRMGFGTSGEDRESIVRDGVATIVVERAGESWRIIVLQNTDKTADRAHVNG
jgi:uncharacterized protein (TIGR02246 family)